MCVRVVTKVVGSKSVVRCNVYCFTGVPVGIGEGGVMKLKLFVVFIFAYCGC